MFDLKKLYNDKLQMYTLWSTNMIYEYNVK